MGDSIKLSKKAFPTSVNPDLLDLVFHMVQVDCQSGESSIRTDHFDVRTGVIRKRKNKIHHHKSREISVANS